MKKTLLHRRILISKLLIPLAILAIDCALFAWITPVSVPRGVNYHFAVDMLWGSLGLIAVTALVLVFVWKRDDETVQPLRTSNAHFRFGDATLLLLPLTPVAQYTLRNSEILSPGNILAVLAFFTLLSALLIYVVPALLRRYTDMRPLVAVGLAFAFTITSMALLSSSLAWYRTGSLKIQLLFFVAVFLLSWLLFSLSDRRILWALVAVVFAVNTSSYLLARDAQALVIEATHSKLPALVDGRKPVSTPNIYLLVYDSYVANETMLGYGLENSAQEDFLRTQGFTLYPRTYSVGATTLTSMSKVLEVADVSAKNWRKEVSGDGVVQNLLKSLGYQTYGIFPSDFMFRGYGSSYDVSVPVKKSAPPSVYLIAGVLMGEFRFDLGFDAQKHGDYVTAKQDIFANLPNKPIFLYSHSNLPGHSQNSGACLADEITQYSKRLERANGEMRQDVATILANDPGAIIIIAGDHGPYLTKNCTHTGDDYRLAEINRLDIQDRFGTFLAIHWPQSGFEAYDQITVLQDVFPAVFANLYQDAGLLDSRVKPLVDQENSISGASIENGIIRGGVDDDQPLFLAGE